MDINISAVIDRFIKLAVETGWLNAMDSIYTPNRLLAYLDMSDYVKDGLGEEKLGLEIKLKKTLSIIRFK